MKTSGGERQTPVHPFHAGKGFHDGTSDAEKFLRPPPHTTSKPLTSTYGTQGEATTKPIPQDRSVRSRCVCASGVPLPPFDGLEGGQDG